MLKRNTTILLFAALLLGGGVLLFEQYQVKNPDAEDTESGTALFKFTEDQVNQLTITKPEQTLTFKRESEKSANAWQMTAPNQGPADEAAIAFVLSQMTTARSERTLEVALQEKAAFGFDQPLATIKVTLKDQTTHQLVLAGKDPVASAVYAQIDPPTPETDPLAVALVPVALLDATERPLNEWEQQADQGDSTPSLPDPN